MIKKTVTPDLGNITGNVIELSDRLVCAKYSGIEIVASTDNGATWITKQAAGHPNANPRSPYIDKSGNLYFSKGLASQSGYLLRSTDDGETWTKVLDTAVLSPSSYGNALWYMAETSNGDIYINGYSFGDDPNEGWQARNVYKSIDNGATWSIFYTHPDEIRHLHGIYIDSLDNMFVSGAHPIFDGQDDPAFTARIGSDGVLGDIITPQGNCGGATGFVQADNGSIFFASDRLNGIFKLVEGAFVNALDPQDFGLGTENFLTIVKGRDGVLYTISNNNEYMFASGDDGETWVYLEFTGITPARPTTLTVGGGSTPYIYWDGGYLANYRRLKDYTREEIKAIYTSRIIINGVIS